MHCIIQCRSDSTRFPGKCFHKIGNKSIIETVYQTCSEILPTIVAIPAGDRKLSNFLSQLYIPTYRGDKDNVLARYYHCAKTFKMPAIMRVTGDCPFIPPETILYMRYMWNNNDLDFLSNCFEPRTTPDGWDCEILSFRLLKMLMGIVTDKSDLEHVTQYIYRNKDNMNIKYMGLNLPINLSKTKCSIDAQEDLVKLKKDGLI